MPLLHKYFVSGIGTDIGKTIVSAILVEKLKADYWKPIQSGSLERTDSMVVRDLITNRTSRFHVESYLLKKPFSPHKSAHLENIEIDFSKINPPNPSSPLIVEGAGGLMVPLNSKQGILDLIRFLGYPIILVSKNYLGSINHTLLSLAKIEQEKLPVKGIIFVGEKDPYTEDFILNNSSVKFLGRVPHLNHIDKRSILLSGKKISL